MLSAKANELIEKYDEPPSWLINLCKSPIGKALFMYVLKDPILQGLLNNGNYNGLIDFFISTLIINSQDLYKDMKDIDLSNCTLSTSILFFEQIIKKFETASSYEECEMLIHSFVEEYSFSCPEELVIFFNYIIEVEKSCSNSSFHSLMETLIEQLFQSVSKKHSVTPVILFIIYFIYRFFYVY